MTSDSDAIFNARVICDMSPYGLGTRECDTTIVFGPNDDPESIAIRFPIPKAKRADVYSKAALDRDRYFGKKDFTGRLTNGKAEFSGRIASISGMQPLGMFEEMQLSCEIDDFKFLDHRKSSQPCIVVFRLTNVPYRLRGDVGVVRPISTRPPTPLETDYFDTTELHTLSDDERSEKFKPGLQFSVSRINFTFCGRTWNLDIAKGHEDKNKSNSAALRPMVTATATTAADSAVDLQKLADYLCDLLTFALGKEVRWVSCGNFSRDGASDSVCRGFPLLPYGKGAGALVDNWEIGDLRQFVEECEPEFTREPDWWHRSIGLLAHARATQLLEIRLSTLNTLVDRISRKVIGELDTFEIDPQLPMRLERRWFRLCLHLLLRTLSGNWDVNRTQTVCDTIKQWNSTPSFPNQVAKACERLGISVPTRKQLGFRHKLLHIGEFDKSLKTAAQMIEDLQSLEAVVELMMIRMLGFTGFVHIDSHGPTWQKVEALLSAERIGEKGGT